MTDQKTVEARRRARALWRLGCASLVVALLVFAFTIWVVYSNAAIAKRDVQLAEQSRRYVDALNEVLGDLKDAETGQRGYVLTHNNRYLEPYNRALVPIRNGLATLAGIAAQRPGQKPAIDRLEAQANFKLRELALTIDLRRTKGFDAALAEISTDQGKAAMDEIRLICKQTIDQESSELLKRTREASERQHDALTLAAAGGGILLVLMTAGFLTLTSGARRQAQLAEGLANSREIFETTLNSIGDGVLATDVTGHITFINPEAATVTGWPRTEALAQLLHNVFHIVNESSRVRTESPFDKIMQTGGVVGLANHTVLIRRDGTEVPIDDSGAPIRDVDGRIIGVVLVFREVSERRKAEAALQQSHNEVLRANEELRQFSYAATHDLQEPLRTLVVFSQLLGRAYRRTLDERGQYLLKTVEDAAQRMSMLVEDLLALMRAGSESTPALSPVDPSEILRDTLVQLHGAIEQNDARITYDDLPVVLSDPAQLSQVFQNLLSNAIKYRKPDLAPVIHVSSIVEGSRATFRVADNGIGFKQEYADRIFLLFQRLHGRDIPGTGIGLALCRRIIERQGGRIWARSEENVGTSFYFTLPLGQEKAAST